MKTLAENKTEEICNSIARKFNICILRFHAYDDTILEKCITRFPNNILINYDQFEDTITDKQFDCCVRAEPISALKLYENFPNRITDEQIDHCIDIVIGSDKDIDYSAFEHRLSDDQIKNLRGY